MGSRFISAVALAERSFCVQDHAFVLMGWPADSHTLAPPLFVGDIPAAEGSLLALLS